MEQLSELERVHVSLKLSSYLLQTGDGQVVSGAQVVLVVAPMKLAMSPPEALAGFGCLSLALRLIARRMRSGCRMNTHKQRPNSAQLLADGLEWALSTA